jgi:hypothetical protein
VVSEGLGFEGGQDEKEEGDREGHMELRGWASERGNRLTDHDLSMSQVFWLHSDTEA